MERIFVTLAGVMGLLAVGLGAFGAHGLKAFLAELPDGAKRMEWWETAAQYNLMHALALAFVSYLVHRTESGLATWAALVFCSGDRTFFGKPLHDDVDWDHEARCYHANRWAVFAGGLDIGGSYCGYFNALDRVHLKLSLRDAGFGVGCKAGTRRNSKAISRASNTASGFEDKSQQISLR